MLRMYTIKELIESLINADGWAEDILLALCFGLLAVLVYALVGQ